MMTRLINLFKDEEGVTALEYGLIAALIAAAIVGAVSALGDQVSATFTYIQEQMAGATTTTGTGT